MEAAHQPAGSRGRLQSVSEAGGEWVIMVTGVVRVSVIMTLTTDNNLDKVFMECDEAASVQTTESLGTSDKSEKKS